MTRWPLPWPKVRPSHLYLGTQNNSLLFFPAATEMPWSGGWMRGECSKLPAHSGASIQVWEQPEGGIWENHGPCLHRSVPTRKAASGSSPGHRPPPQIKANGASAAPGEKPTAGQRHESMNADTLVSSTTVFCISEQPGKPALEVSQRLSHVLTWGISSDGMQEERFGLRDRVEPAPPNPRCC